jgi:hypothetical protein
MFCSEDTMAEILGLSKSIWGFSPTSIPGAVLWLDGGDSNTMFQDTGGVTPITGGGQTVQRWNDKSGNSNNVVGSGAWSGSNVVFNGSTNAFSNTTYVWPFSNTLLTGGYSLFAVYSNTVAPAAAAYMNVVYSGAGFPMLGVFGPTKLVTARAVVGNINGMSTIATSNTVGWAARIASTSNDGVYGVATDPSGNVIVSGVYQATALTFYDTGNESGGIARYTLSATGATTNCFIAKYATNGTVSWATRIGGASNQQSSICASDSSGNIFVTGTYSNTACTFYNVDTTIGLTFSTPGAATASFLAKYTSVGTFIWAVRFATTPSNIVAYAVATDPSGNALVTGYATSSGLPTFYNSNTTIGAQLPATAAFDCFIVKYTPDGDVSWATRISSAGNDIGYGIATDPSGNVFVTGQYSAAVTLYNQPGTVSNAALPFTGGTEVFIAKYTSAGTVSWAARISSAGNDIGYGIATDLSGNAFVTGQYSGAASVSNANGTLFTTLAATGSSDTFVAGYSPIGAVLWAARNGSLDSDIGYGIATDLSGNVFVTGSYYGGTAAGSNLSVYNASGTLFATLGSVTFTFSAFLVKYSPIGVVLFATRFLVNTPRGVAVDASGNVFTGGGYNFSPLFSNSNGSTGAMLVTSEQADGYVTKQNASGNFTEAGPTLGDASSNVLVAATWLRTTAIMRVYVNGSYVTPQRSGTTLTTTGFYIGGPSNYFNGTVSEVLIYNSDLSCNQRQVVEGYLALKWGLRSSLTTFQPYYSIPSFNRAFIPSDIPLCSIWLDGADNSTMNSTSAVTVWNDKSGLRNNMTGSGTWSGSNMVFNGSTNAFSNTTFLLPSNAFSIFAVYSNTVAPAATAYMNMVYGGTTGGYPMIGVYGSNKEFTARLTSNDTGAVGAFAPGGWVAYIQSSTVTTSDNVPYQVTTDSSCNVYLIATSTSNSRAFNANGTVGATLPNVGVTPNLVAKYSPTGTVSWVAQMGSATASLNFVRGVTVDSSGNVFVVGSYRTTALTIYNADGTSGKVLAFSGSQSCGFLAKYSSAGVLSWAVRMLSSGSAGGGSFGCSAVGVDPGGNVYVAGVDNNAGVTHTTTFSNSNDTVGLTYTFNSGTGVSSGGFLVKYADAGTATWVTRWESLQPISPSNIAVDSASNVYVAGTSGGQDPVRFSNANGTLVVTLSNNLINQFRGYVAKYSTLGVVQFVLRIETISNLVPGALLTGISLDSSSNIFVSGYSSGGANFYNSNTTTIGTSVQPLSPVNNVTDGWIAKYSSVGTALWAARIASTCNDFTSGISTDPGGNVFVNGATSGVAGAIQFNNSNASVGATLSGVNIGWIAKYSTSGIVQWALSTAFGPGTGFVGLITTDLAGNIIIPSLIRYQFTPVNVGGSLATTITATCNTVNNQSAVIVKYRPDGYMLGPYPMVSNVLAGVVWPTPPAAVNNVGGVTLSTLYIDGAVASRQQASNYLTAAGLNIGGPSNYFNGSLSELIIYGATLTTVQRQKVERYLSGKWGLLPSLLANQPSILPAETPTPAYYTDVTAGNWTRDWQPYLKQLAAANSNATVTSTNIFTGTTGPIYGTDSYPGGVLGPDGFIYFGPGPQLNQVFIKLNVATGAASSLSRTAAVTNANGPGVLGPDGNIYYSPHSGTNIVKLDVATNALTAITGGATIATAFGWWAGVLGPDGNIYFGPYRATNIIKLQVHPTTPVTTNIATTTTGTRGGVLGPDGNIYWPPYDGTNFIIKLTVATGVVTTIATANAGYIGGVLAYDGNIYFSPDTAGRFLKLDVTTGLTTIITGGATYSSGYQSSAIGPDGNIYTIPGNGPATSIIKLNVATGVTTNIAMGGIKRSLGGILAPDGNIYCGPGSTGILKIGFSGVSQLPSMNYCLSAYANKW